MGKAEKMAKYVVQEHVLFQEVDGVILVVDTNEEQYYDFNEVGGEIWAALERGKDTAEIAELLIREYEIEPQLAYSDVEKFVQSLLDRELVKAERGNDEESL